MKLKNKKILLVGLGILGGGLSMAKFLISKGARLTITDLRNKNELGGMIKKLPSTVKYTLEKHNTSDFENADIIIFNPAVSYFGKWVKLAQKLQKEFYNDYTFFLKNLEGRKEQPLIIGITGTRGKTTIANWTNHLIPSSVVGGNIPDKNLLKIMDKKTKVFVLELSSYQLEFAQKNATAPDIAVLTNIYVDHLNRYGSFEKYKEVKFNIFKNQTANDALILNNDEQIAKEILSKNPKAHLFFISTKTLPRDENGLFFEKDKIFYQHNGAKSLAGTVTGLAPHEKANLLCAMMAAHLAGVDGKEITSRIKNLPQVKFRQEVIYDKKRLKIINDSAGTSPDAAIAAVEKFKDQDNFVLICGGTDKKLEFDTLAKIIKKYVKPENLFLLSGSATNKLKAALHKLMYISSIKEFDGLEELVKDLSENVKNGAIVFSPGCASFEKFKNEFDRGEKFNRLVRKYFKNG